MFLRVGLCVSVLFLTSCGGGPKLTKVSGNVKYKGKAVADATVIFEPDGGGIVGAATTDSSGNYTLGSNSGAGVPAGAYSVKIQSKVKLVENTSPMAGLEPGSKEYEAAYMKASSSGTKSSSYKTAKDSEAIPEKYGTGSELKQIVEAGPSQVIDFDLK
jgi:hypothetical protein